MVDRRDINPRARGYINSTLQWQDRQESWYTRLMGEIARSYGYRVFTVNIQYFDLKESKNFRYTFKFSQFDMVKYDSNYKVLQVNSIASEKDPLVTISAIAARNKRLIDVDESFFWVDKDINEIKTAGQITLMKNGKPWFAAIFEKLESE